MIREPNYTQIPNEFLDKIMPTLSGAENVVFLVIMRKTFGWHKKKDKISYSQIREGSGISSNTTIQTALKKLQEKGLVFIVKEKKGITYEVNITETVNEENEDLYKNCKDTFTETVNIKDKTFTETVNTKESNIKKLSKEIYIKIDEAYIDAYKELKHQDPKIFYPAVRKRQKILLENGFTQDDIIMAIQEGKKDRWLVGNGFDFLTLLSEKILPRLVNQARASSPLSEKEKQLCPACGGEVIGGMCTSCRSLIGQNGEII